MNRHLSCAIAAAVMAASACDDSSAVPAPPTVAGIAVGESWTVQRSAEVFEGLPYKVEDGRLEACEIYEATETTYCLSTAQGYYTSQSYTDSITAAAPTKVASLDRTGLFVKSHSVGTKEEGSYELATGRTEPTNDIVQLEHTRSIYTLVEHNGFLLRQTPLGGDFDLGFGETLYPIDPEPGASYTDANGQTWMAIGRETVTNGDKQWATVVVTNAVEQSIPMSLGKFVESCVVAEREFEGSSYIRYYIHESCEDRTINGWSQLWIQGSQLVKSNSYRETIEFFDVGVRNEMGWLDSYVDSDEDPTRPLVVVFELRRIRQATELLEWNR